MSNIKIENVRKIGGGGAADAVEIGKPVTVVGLRNGERVSLSVTPEARK
mgnify:CR=1 FL=1